MFHSLYEYVVRRDALSTHDWIVDVISHNLLSMITAQNKDPDGICGGPAGTRFSRVSGNGLRVEFYR